MGFRSDQAIYPQLVSIIKRKIVAGVYSAGSKLSSVRELAEESRVNPNTMQRALTGLEQEDSYIHNVLQVVLSVKINQCLIKLCIST